MTGFEPQTSGIGSDHSTKWATTTAPTTSVYCHDDDRKYYVQGSEKQDHFTIV